MLTHDVRTSRARRVTPLTTLMMSAVEAAADGSLVPCQVNDASLWFAEGPEAANRAKSLCRECPLRQECLAGALDREEPWGVWGGEIFLQGMVVQHKRAPGRPRKRPYAA